MRCRILRCQMTDGRCQRGDARYGTGDVRYVRLLKLSQNSDNFRSEDEDE